MVVCPGFGGDGPGAWRARRTRVAAEGCRELRRTERGPERHAMDPSILNAMDKDALTKQIHNMRYQSTMERWPLSKSIQA